MLWRVAQRDCVVAAMPPVFGANWRTAADVKSVHDHLSRHHAGRKIERARFDISLGIGLGTSPYVPEHGPAVKTAIAAVSLEFAASPLAPQPDWLYGSFPWPCEIMPHW
jgi:hypothetical protein